MGRSVDAEITNPVPAASRTVSGALRGELAEALAESARKIVRGAQSRVPVLSGAARSSLGVESADDGAMIVAGGSRAPYFHILEYGSRFVRGGHYIGKATEATMADLERAALEGVKDAVRRGGFDVG